MWVAIERPMEIWAAVVECRQGRPDAVKGDKDTCASGISCLRRPIDRSACRHEWTGSMKHGAQVGQKAPVLLSQSYPAAGLAY